MSDRLGHNPISTWDEMQHKLREEYLPTRDQLRDELANLRQGIMTVAEYKAKLHELLMRCDLVEDSSVTLSRFRTGLRPDIKRGLLPHLVYTLDHVFLVAVDGDAQL